MLVALAASLVLLAAAPQQHGNASQAEVEQMVDRAGYGEPEEHGESEGVDFMHHILDSREIELPGRVIHLPEAGTWTVAGIDLTPTKHVVFLGLAGLLTLALLLPTAALAKRAGHGPARGKRHNSLEAVILFLRDQIIVPYGSQKYAPFILSLFFFILFANILGLLPWGSTATANIAVTAALALLSFLVTEVSGMRALGAGYLNTIVYWNRDLSPAMRVLLAVIMTPVELVGKFTKPFALAIRLMANMTAGHIVILSLINLIFVFGALFGGGALAFGGAVFPLVMAVAINLLEIFVALLQAYVFAMLTSVFIGQLQHAHH